MEQSKSACIVLVVMFLLFIYAEPAVQAISDIRNGQAPIALDVFKRAPSPTNLRAYEDTLREQSVVANAVRPHLQHWRFEVMDDAGKNGLIGRDGWLFYRPGVRFLVEPWRRAGEDQEPLRAITSFRDQLEARGIELLLVITPGKESVYPNRLTRRASEAVNGHVTTFMDSLKKSGIEAVYADASAESGGDESAYLAQDTHWTPSHARDVARRVAGFAIGKGWVQKGNAIYDERALTIERHGDILRMAKSEPLLKSYTPEKISCWQVVDRTTGELYKDSPDSPVLVLGDSFLRIFQLDEPKNAGFIAHLARALQMPVTSIVNDGGASTLVRQELRRKPEMLKGKKLVIWEFVERDLRFGTDGWQIVELPD
ncbi:MAG: hypothetical protein IT366_07810 [Candidatus Hydrogenedentes bacterium]|nr:hypothetical protein [Candidatus Hydrogenedentota bacterium]